MRFYNKNSPPLSIIPRLIFLVMTPISVLFALYWNYIIGGILFGSVILLYIMLVQISFYSELIFVSIVVAAPQIPEIKYAEFPFEIVYSIDDEIYEINDVYVCEYEGIGGECKTKKLIWNTYLKYSGDEYAELMPYNSSGSLCLYLGSPEYYMMGSFPGYGEHVPGEYIHHSLNHKREEISFEEAKEEYGLEIISTKFSEPIENKLEYRTIDKIRLFLFGAFFDE